MTGGALICDDANPTAQHTTAYDTGGTMVTPAGSSRLDDAAPDEGPQKSEHPTPTRALRAARVGRAGLRNALVQLEAAVAAPVPGGVHVWSRAVHEALVSLQAAFERHLAITEGPGGLMDEIMGSSPHLAHAVDMVCGEHRSIGRQIADVAADARMTDPVPAAAADVREQVLHLLEALIRHRQIGADLVYEAYAIDIGGSE